MLSERHYNYEERERPWTVPALIGFGIFSWLVSVIFDLSFASEGGQDRYKGWGYTLMGLVLIAAYYRGLWLGRRWAYVFSIVMTVFTVVVLIPYLGSERVELPEVLWLVVALVTQTYLLFHPATRAYFKEHPLMEGSDAEKLSR